MRIEIRSNVSKLFEQIQPGEVFCVRYDDDDIEYYIKTENIVDETCDRTYNAVNLKSGSHNAMDQKDVVDIPNYRFAVQQTAAR